MQEVTDVQAYVYLGQIADRMDTAVTHLQLFLVLFGIAVSMFLAILFIRKYVIGMFSSWGGRFKL